MRTRNVLIPLATLILFCLACRRASAAEYIWIEGESTKSSPELKKGEGAEKVKGGKGYDTSGWGNTKMMSGGTVLHVSLSDGEVGKFMPDEGLVFAYPFELQKNGKQNVWARIGYEWIRSDFQWRLDGGEWRDSKNDEATINIQPIQTWNELGWIKLTEADLKAGKHTLEFRHQKQTFMDSKGKEKVSRILHILDCICITPEEFVPQGKLKPDEIPSREIDKQAEANVFKLEPAAGSERVSKQLDGLWQFAAWDETEFPIKEEARCKAPDKLPDLSKLKWFAFNAPGSRNAQLPEQGFAHRYLLKCKVDIPAELKGKALYLDVQRSNLIASVFVNGVYCGWTKTFHTAWQLDLTKGVKPGQVNEIVICMKDAYYSINPTLDNKDERAKKLGNRTCWNLPPEHISRNANHDFPIAADVSTGILEPATIVAAGPVYAADVFAIPSLKGKNLGLEISLHNPSAGAVKVELANSVIPWNKGQGGESECALPAQTVELAAGETKTVKLEQGWENPHIWWPDDPFLYWIKTDVKLGGKVVDTLRTRFGFREWDWSTHMFVLNGIKWPMYADLSVNGKDPKIQVKTAREKSHQNHMRLWTDRGLGSMTRRESLNYFDETGMLVRSSGTFDGQVISYWGGLRRPDKTQAPDKRGNYPLVANRPLFDNWFDQLEAWVKEERNHPSIYIWSMENEITYINSHNLGMYKEVEPEMTKAAKRLKQVDPTRPSMVDGGNCLRDESLEVNGAHYTEFMNCDFRDFPDKAYTREHFYDKNNPQRGAWRMVPDRPIMKGEVYFAEGYTPGTFATIGGDSCFIGRGETAYARGLWAKMLSEGYRWCEVSSFQYWMGGSADKFYWNSWSPVAVFCRQWNWSWLENKEIKRTLKVFNSTRHADPIEVTWTFNLDGRKISGETKTFNVKPGEAEEFEISFKTPTVKARSEGEFVLTANRGGKEVYREAKPVSVLAPDRIAKPELGKGDLAVFDPSGEIKTYLNARGIAFTDVAEYGKIPEAAKVIVVGKDAVPVDRASDKIWAAMASKGKKVLVLDQQNPLVFGAIPTDLKPTGYTGRIGFSEDLTHPAFDGMTQADFFTWGNDHVVYRNVYKKGTRGGRSLFQCERDLACTALFESQINDGLLLLSQLAIGDKLADNGPARQVFNNLLNYVASYKAIRKETLVAMPAGSGKTELLKNINVKLTEVGSALEAVQAGKVAVVEASPENLKILADNKDKVEKACQEGGWLMLWGLTPDGLTDYNRLVGFSHSIRPFDQERVILSMPTDSLASGITLRDVVMDTGQKMYPWMALKKPDKTAFSYIISHTDIAPFCKFPSPVEMGKSNNENPGVDHQPRNMVNGFTTEDNWCFCYTIIMDQGHKRKFTLELPAEEELVALKIRPSKIYHPITGMKIYFDDDPQPVEVKIPVRENPVTEDVPVPGRKAKKITLEVAEWMERGNANIVVIDNLWLQIKRSEDYKKRVGSILNVGGLMRYSIGSGGIFLNQINLLEQESNPVNAEKKATIVKTLLKNMGAEFAGTKTEIGQETFGFAPVKIPDNKFNAFVNHTGNPTWFKSNLGDISSIPVGEQTFGGVDYKLTDFNTSPVPSVMMLAGEGSSVNDQSIKDIKVDAKADALFFLHTMNVGRDLRRWEGQVQDSLRRGRPAPDPRKAFSYIVYYEDSSKAEVPVIYGRNVGGWDDKNPQTLEAATLAWVGKPANAKAGEKAAVYSMRWDNPSPEKKIVSIEIKAEGNGTGAAAVFAITAAMKRK